MQQPDRGSQINAQVEEDHRELLGLLGQIERGLKQPTPAHAELADLLGRLSARLDRHFALEEEGGYFAEAVAHAPQLAEKARGLVAEHTALADQARELAKRAGRTGVSETDWESIHTGFRAFLRQITLHEQQEDGLIQEAYTRDLGAFD